MSSPFNNFKSPLSRNVDVVQIMHEEMIEEEASDSLVSSNLLSDKQYSNQNEQINREISVRVIDEDDNFSSVKRLKTMHPEKLTSMVEKKDILASKIYQDLAAEKKRIEYAYDEQKKLYQELLNGANMKTSFANDDVISMHDEIES